MSTDITKERIKALRKERKMTQQDLAVLCGVSQQAIGYWESMSEKGTIPNLDNIVSLAKAFLVSTDYLLGLTDQRHSLSSTQANSFLSADEAKIIQQYRQLDERGKQTVLIMIDSQLQALAKPAPAVATAEDERTFQKEAIL